MPESGTSTGTEAWGGNCSGIAYGNLYLQYWLYYPGSATAEGSTPLKGPIRRLSNALGHSTYHPDDWEGYQVRIGHGRNLRASHLASRLQRLAARRRPLLHLRRQPRRAGRCERPARSWIRVRLPSAATGAPRTDGSCLIPLETLPAATGTRFAISPPWRKRVWFDPEYAGTDLTLFPQVAYAAVYPGRRSTNLRALALVAVKALLRLRRLSSGVDDLAIITVSTNEAQWIRPCLSTVFAHMGDVSADVVVVDNESHDGTADVVETEFPDARIVPSRNHGFSHANNRGLMTCDARYVLFLNPDTEIVEGTFEDLVGAMDARPTVGLIGVRQVDPGRAP